MKPHPPKRTSAQKAGMIVLSIIGLLAVLAIWENTLPEETRAAEPEIVAEAAAKSVGFESITTPGAERETVHIEFDRVTIAKPLSSVRFVENPDSTELLVRKQTQQTDFAEDLEQTYVVLVPTKRIGVIKSQHLEVFNHEMVVEQK